MVRRKILFRVLLSLFALGVLGVGLLIYDGLTDDLRKCDVGLVLGSKVETDGTPSSRLRARLDRAADLYRDGYFPRVLVSGGVGKEGYDEAIVMRDYLVNKGVPSAQILIDSKGINTFETARSTREFAEKDPFESVMVISQFFHISRSKLALRKFGFSQVGSAHAHIFEWRDLYSVLREAAGYPAYCLRSPQK